MIGASLVAPPVAGRVDVFGQVIGDAGHVSVILLPLMKIVVGNRILDKCPRRSYDQRLYSPVIHMFFGL